MFIRLLAIFFLLATHYIYAGESVRLLSTTSTRDSGFLDYILPMFEREYNIKVLPIILGTGQALVAAQNCDGDILLTHAPKLEKEFVNNNYGIIRTPFMYNDFVVIGPKEDKFKINNNDNVLDVFETIKKNKLKFISRGDNSGTNFSELLIWDKITFNPSVNDRSWYLQSGQGMGATLNIAVGMNAYTYSDRSTWIKFQNKQQHKILFQGDRHLLNEYSIIILNNEKCPHINQDSAIKLYKWITSPKTKDIINNYEINGSQVFFTNYKLSND